MEMNEYPGVEDRPIVGLVAGGRRSARLSLPSMRSNAAIGRLVETARGRAGRGRDGDPVRGRRLALRLQPPAHLVRRACLDPVPVARHARRGRRLSARRAYAAAAAHRHGRRRDGAPSSRPWRFCVGARLPRLRPAPAVEYAIDEAVMVDAGARDPDASGVPPRSPVGIALMLSSPASRADRAAPRSRDIALAVGRRSSAVGVRALMLAEPALRALGNYNLVSSSCCRRGGAVSRRRADRLRLRHRHLRLSRADDHGSPMTVVIGRHGRGHVAHHPARGAALRLPRPADRDHRACARTGRLPREPASAMSAAACTMCCSAPCISSPASPARRPPTWRRWRPCFSRR